MKSTTTNMRLAATLEAKDIPVEYFRKPARPQIVVAEYPNTPQTRSVVESFERNEDLGIPAKKLLKIYTDLGYRCKRLIMEAL